jgi:hypothetical protein
MNQQQLNNQIRRFVTSNRVTNPINVTFTQKQSVNGFRVDDVVSEKNFKHFKNKLNTKLFGNGYKRFNKQLQMLVVREVSSNHRHHLHCIIEQPQRIGFEQFTHLIEEVWKSTDFGYEEIHIEKPSSQLREDGWLSYIMKDRTKVNLNTSVDWINTSISNHC